MERLHEESFTLLQQSRVGLIGDSDEDGAEEDEGLDLGTRTEDEDDPEVVTEDGVADLTTIWEELITSDPAPVGGDDDFDSDDFELLGGPRGKKPMKAAAPAEKRDFGNFKNKLFEKLRALLSSKKFLAGGGQLVFPCRRNYANANIHPKMPGAAGKKKAAPAENARVGGASLSGASSSAATTGAAGASSSSANSLPDAAAPLEEQQPKSVAPVPPASAKTPLTQAQLKKLKDHELAVVQAVQSVMPGGDFLLRIYVEDAEAADDGFQIIGVHNKFPAKFPKRMKYSDMHHYLEIALADDFDPSKPPRNQHWVGDFEDAAAEMHSAEMYHDFQKKKRGGRGGGGFGGLFGGFGGGFDDFSDGFSDSEEKDFKTQIVRTALHVLVPEWGKRGQGKNESSGADGNNKFGGKAAPKSAGGKAKAKGKASAKAKGKASAKAKAAGRAKATAAVAKGGAKAGAQPKKRAKEEGQERAAKVAKK